MKKTTPMSREEKKVIAASSAGTVFEWYDFFLYGSLSAVIGDQFFSAFPEATRNIFALLAFAVGFLVRPLGAIVFGRLGDMIGRKYTFLATITIMGFSTFIVGLLPSYATIGTAAPIILLGLRVLQGLALGGEYGGAATYVAEHAPQNRRGFFTSWINSTATLGLLLSLIVILATRGTMGEDPFKAWGWRIPFLFSIMLLGISVYIRMQMEESPAFRKIRDERRQSEAPLKEAFTEWRHLKYVLAAFLGLSAGFTVMWYAAHFYTLFFLQNVLRVDAFTSSIVVACALVVAIGAYIFFGALSDRIGRKPVILGGFALGILCCIPLYQALTATASPALDAAQKGEIVIVTADPKDCSFQFNATGTSKFTSSCDVAKAVLTKNSVNYRVTHVEGAIPATVSIGKKDIVSYDAAKLTPEQQSVPAAFAKEMTEALQALGYPVAGAPDSQLLKIEKAADLFKPQALKTILILSLLVAIAAMSYAPLAAALAELFPTRIRYSAMSLPYNLGAGWFGGLMPATAFAMSAEKGNIYFGLWYPVGVMMMSFLIVLFFIPETKDRDIFEGD